MRYVLLLIIVLISHIDVFALATMDNVVRPQWWINVMKDVEVDLPPEIEAKRVERGYLEFSDLLEAKCPREKVKQVNESIEKRYLEFMNTPENKDKLKTIIVGSYRGKGYPQQVYKDDGKYFLLIDDNMDCFPDIVRDIRNLSYLSKGKYDIIIFEGMMLLYRYTKSTVNGALASLKSGGKLVIDLIDLVYGKPMPTWVETYKYLWNYIFEDGKLIEPISYENADIEVPVINFGKDGDQFFAGTVYSNAKEIEGVDFKWPSAKTENIQYTYFSNRKELIWKLFENLGVDMTQVASLKVVKVKSGSDLYPKQKEEINDVLIITKK